jgi:hypothetical protein
MKRLLPFLLLGACDDPLKQGNIEQLPNDSYVELRQFCLDLYNMTKGVPSTGWYNQLAIEAYSGTDIMSENNTQALRTLVSKYGLLKMYSDPELVTVETVFYSWDDPQDKAELLSMFDKCK